MNIVKELNQTTKKRMTYTEERTYWFQCMIKAHEYGLDAEVAVMALEYLKEDPKLSISQCLEMALKDMIRNLCREIIKEEITNRLSIDISLKKKEG